MLKAESKLILPSAPSDVAGQPVAAWAQPVNIDTYEVDPPDIYPAYLDRRVYQGSSGRVYPLPFYERVQDHKRPRSWQAIHLENRYVRLMILPELGGRIHFGLDKTREYDFFYRNNVIKPALVGVTGPWLSGGVEFNWPQHHRPATYLPVSWAIEEEADGSRTVWCADLDPFSRMHEMHGVRLRPDSSLIELRVRLFNRSDDVQTFLWWANVAARVNDDYQSFFPTDVHFVADHAKRAVTSFPAANGHYYGVDYPARVSPDNPDADRLDWYRNIPVPTSYMCLGSADDFFGGYDHGRGAGFVHWADHRISPGKKQWTWGNAPFGWAWDRNLTDGDGPYVELMAGVFTDNQPDFSFLAPGETKSFSQYWYPIQDIGPAQQATRDGAVSLALDGGYAEIGFVPTRPVQASTRLESGGQVLWAAESHAQPGMPLIARVEVAEGTRLPDLSLVIECDGEELIRWTPREAPQSVSLPDPADEPGDPQDIPTIEELYLTGLHLEQYRHATRSPEPYWLEALRRDPGDIRANVALAARHYRDGLLDLAASRLEKAVTRLTRRNPNPYDGEAHYRLGQVRLAQGDLDAADAAFGKASWNAAWKSPSEVALARIAARRGDWASVLERALAVSEADPRQRQATALAVIALRRLGRDGEAALRLEAARRSATIDWWLADLADELTGTDVPTLIDLALEYASLGLFDDATRLLRVAERQESQAPVEGFGRQMPLILLHRANVEELAGHRQGALELIERATSEDRRTCFPGRLADALMLTRLLEIAPGNPAIGALLGHWLYSRGRADDAIGAWALAGDDPVALRNLGVAAFNHLGDPVAATDYYEKALSLAPRDSRLWYERDQLAARIGEPLQVRVDRLQARTEIVASRDDLSVEYADLLVGVGRHGEALELLKGRTFQPWEGGEGKVLAVWERANLAAARAALALGDSAEAVKLVEAAIELTPSLGEARHLLANVAHLDLALGDALAADGREEEARRAWTRATAVQGDFVAMATTAYSVRSLFSAVALQRLGRRDEAESLALAARDWARAERAVTVRIDFFATSLPTLLLFHEDIQWRHELTCDVILAQGAAVLGDAAGLDDLINAILARDPSESFARDLVGLVRD